MPDLKLYYRGIMTKTAWSWYRDRQVDQWNIIEDPEMNTYTYVHLIFEKELKSSRGKNTAFSTNGPISTGSQYVEDCSRSILISLYNVK